MAVILHEQQVHTLEFIREEEIAAPIDLVFESVLEQMGPENSTPDLTPMPMVLKAWPGGRWYRDLGANAGHFWGTVQAIKPSSLLEICGPLFMSYPALSNVQYRLTEVDGVTRLKFTHRAIGLVAHPVQVENGWNHIIDRIRSVAQLRCEKVAVQ
jgi:uncharacterized protein YndB with AHSA1/START domain